MPAGVRWLETVIDFKENFFNRPAASLLPVTGLPITAVQLPRSIMPRPGRLTASLRASFRIMPIDVEVVAIRAW